MTDNVIVTDKEITHLEIYPPLGIIRVGNSPDQYFIGPEVPYSLPDNNNVYKDENNNISRQVARFRIYAFNKSNQVIKEIIPQDDDVTVTWQVHVANKKASWYQFNLAFDVSEAPPVTRRNPTFQTPEDRKKLIIDPGEVNINGKKESAPVPLVGQLFDQTIYLGELRTDELGRLLVFPGRGRSGTFTGRQIDIADFANNDNWFDDTCDGPVSAIVTFKDRTLPLVPKHGWVACAPPNFAPDIVTPVTMYDLIYDVLFGNPTGSKYYNQSKAKKQVSFRKDILPLLQQFSHTQWVNRGFFSIFGFESPFDFEYDDVLLRKLSYGGNDEAKAQVYSETRDLIYRSIRLPGQGADRSLWPPIFGDNPTTHGASNSNSYLSVTPTQANNLAQWKAGNFVDDYDAEQPPQVPIDQIPLHLQPETLTIAALHYCMGGAFHPGSELPWIMRLASIYDGGLRIRIDPTGAVTATDLGEIYNPSINGVPPSFPFLEQQPGDITKWMAVPWQTDTASCRSGYDQSYNRYLVTFWPSRVPNQIISDESFKIIDDASKSADARTAAFHVREDWLRGLGIDTSAANAFSSNYWYQVSNMLTSWYKQGIIVKKSLQHQTAYLPKELYVESGWGFLPDPEKLQDESTSSTHPVFAKLRTATGPDAAKNSNIAQKILKGPTSEQIATANKELFAAWSKQHTSAHSHKNK